jgi:hypothetical protein
MRIAAEKEARRMQILSFVLPEKESGIASQQGKFLPHTVCCIP